MKNKMKTDELSEIRRRERKKTSASAKIIAIINEMKNRKYLSLNGELICLIYLCSLIEIIIIHLILFKSKYFPILVELILTVTPSQCSMHDKCNEQSNQCNAMQMYVDVIRREKEREKREREQKKEKKKETKNKHSAFAMQNGKWK